MCCTLECKLMKALVFLTYRQISDRFSMVWRLSVSVQRATCLFSLVQWNINVGQIV